MRPALGAVAFLTRLPVRGAAPDAGDLVRGAVLFPVVGAAVGALVGGVAAALALAVPALIAAAAAVAVELALTGALHVDGLADSADALAGRDRERALAVMRDHSVGAYGASALVLDLLAKAAALAVLAEEGAVLAVVAALAISRAAALPLAAALPYARPGPGTGRLLAERLRAPTAAAGIAVAAAIAGLALGAAGLDLAGAALAGPLAGLACLVVVAGAVGALARRRLGGVTGDVMGAAVELTATLGLIVAAA